MFMLLLSSADFLQNELFSKISFRNTIRVSNSLDTDQDRHSVGPDLDPNCLQRLSRTVSHRVDEVIPLDHPRCEASRVIQWYGLIHET